MPKHVPALVALEAVTRDAEAGPALRAVAAALIDQGGLLPRIDHRIAIDGLDPVARKRLRKIGITIGALDLFDARLLKPAAARWRRALIAARHARPVAAAPAEGATVLPRTAPGAHLSQGYRAIALQAVRVDLVERIAKAAFEARSGRKPFSPDPALAISIGVQPATLERLMAGLGFKMARPEDQTARWVWRGRAPAPVAPPSRDNAFSALADLNLRHG